jgi:hypothetical protein
MKTLSLTRIPYQIDFYKWIEKCKKRNNNNSNLFLLYVFLVLASPKTAANHDFFYVSRLFLSGEISHAFFQYKTNK